jgi:hypothetical protein
MKSCEYAPTDGIHNTLFSPLLTMGPAAVEAFLRQPFIAIQNVAS